MSTKVFFTGLTVVACELVGLLGTPFGVVGVIIMAFGCALAFLDK